MDGLSRPFNLPREGSGEIFPSTWGIFPQHIDLRMPTPLPADEQ